MKIKTLDSRPLLLRPARFATMAPSSSRGEIVMAEKEKKESYQPGPPSGLATVPYDLPSQESIDTLTRLLREFDRRSANGSPLPPEIERDIADVTAAFKAIQHALALKPSPLRITDISPLTGPAGTSVTITGCNFLRGSTVRFGDKDAHVDVVSLTEICATTPSGPAGAVDVVVKTFAGSAVPVKGFKNSAG